MSQGRQEARGNWEMCPERHLAETRLVPSRVTMYATRVKINARRPPSLKVIENCVASPNLLNDQESEQPIRWRSGNGRAWLGLKTCTLWLVMSRRWFCVRWVRWIPISPVMMIDLTALKMMLRVKAILYIYLPYGHRGRLQAHLHNLAGNADPA